MRWYVHNLSYLFFFILIFSCKKDSFDYQENTNFTFDSEGKTFVFNQDDLATSIQREVIVQIPSGAVSESHSLLFNSYQLADYQSLNGHYIDFFLSDINYLTCSCDELSVPATIVLPYRNIMNWIGYGYSPFYINVQPEENMFSALNDSARWVPIAVPYTVDNILKTVTFEVNNLNGVYLIGKAK